MSPISSDEEYLSDKSDEDGDITGHDIVTEVDAYTDPTSSSQLEYHDHTTAVTLYKLCGDNIDKTVHQRYMRSDSHGTRSLHYFHSYAIADRINFSNLSQETQPSRSLNSHTQALLLLPSLEDEEALKKNFKILISRFLYDNLPFFRTSFDGIVNWHIKHSYYDEMSKKSDTVSLSFYCTNIIFCV